MKLNFYIFFLCSWFISASENNILPTKFSWPIEQREYRILTHEEIYQKAAREGKKIVEIGPAEIPCCIGVKCTYLDIDQTYLNKIAAKPPHPEVTYIQCDVFKDEEIPKLPINGVDIFILKNFHLYGFEFLSPIQKQFKIDGLIHNMNQLLNLLKKYLSKKGKIYIFANQSNNRIMINGDWLLDDCRSSDVLPNKNISLEMPQETINLILHSLIAKEARQKGFTAAPIEWAMPNNQSLFGIELSIF